MKAENGCECVNVLMRYCVSGWRGSLAFRFPLSVFRFQSASEVISVTKFR